MVIKLHTPVLERFETKERININSCEWPNCCEDGPHRAPYSRSRPNKFRWFCKVHAAQYNKAWNFFDNMTNEEVEAIVRCDTVWNRPSWPIGAGPAIQAFMGGHFQDTFGNFERDKSHSQAPFEETQRFEPSKELRQAMQVFGINSLKNENLVKQRYKKLVKRHHPDAQGPRLDSEDRIKEINHAYTIIMNFFET